MLLAKEPRRPLCTTECRHADLDKRAAATAAAAMDELGQETFANTRFAAQQDGGVVRPVPQVGDDHLLHFYPQGGEHVEHQVVGHRAG